MAKKKRYRVVGVNERGWRVGEHHHHARLTDHDVELIRQLRDEGMKLKEIAEKFDCAVRTIRDIIFLRRRAQFVARFIKVRVNPKKR